MKKKISKLVALACVPVLLFAGCSDSETNEAQTTTAEATTQGGSGQSDSKTDGEVGLDYKFAGNEAEKAGYAEGTITLSSSELQYCPSKYSST